MQPSLTSKYRVYVWVPVSALSVCNLEAAPALFPGVGLPETVLRPRLTKEVKRVHVLVAVRRRVGRLLTLRLWSL